MKFLVDTHTVIWSVDHEDKLGANARMLLTDPDHIFLFSAASLWEIAIKVSLKKLALTLPYREWILGASVDLDLELLPITLENCETLSTLPMGDHRDPFDRLIVAQALIENIPIISSDEQLDAYGITRIW